MFDGKAFGQEVVAAVKAHISSVIAPALARIADLEKQLKELPAPTHGVDGKDADASAIVAIVKSELEPAIVALGRRVDSIVIPDLPDVAEMIAAAINTLPPPEKGEKGDPGDRGEKGEPGRDGQDGRNGIDVVKFIRDADRHLIAVMSDGSTVDLGEYVGKDGPAGRDGADGLGFDSMDLVETEEGVFLRFVRGDVVKDFRLPVVVDRGVWQEREYLPGDGVTWAGSFWIAQQKTAEKPDSGDGWRLAVKRGRDGKSAPAAAALAKTPIRVGVPSKGE